MIHTNRLLFSTKGLYNGIVLPLIIYIAGIICFFTMFPEAMTTPLGYIISLLMVSVFIKPFLDSVNLKRSYIELYDCYVSGQAVPENSFVNNTPIKFNLRYEDICNVEIQAKKVKIYFFGGSYTVQANGVESDVANIIQIQKNKLS